MAPLKLALVHLEAKSFGQFRTLELHNSAQRSNGVASAVRHVRQPSHGGALVIRRKVCVLPRDWRR